MRVLYAILCLLLIAPAALAGPADDEAAKAAVAVELAKLRLKNAPTVPKLPVPSVVPVERDRFIGSDGVMYEKCDDGWYRPVAGANVQKTPTPAVVGAGTFQNGSYNASHACPRCGLDNRDTHTIRGYNRDGTHTHSCPVDGTTWRH